MNYKDLMWTKIILGGITQPIERGISFYCICKPFCLPIVGIKKHSDELSILFCFYIIVIIVLVKHLKITLQTILRNTPLSIILSQRTHPGPMKRIRLCDNTSTESCLAIVLTSDIEVGR